MWEPKPWPSRSSKPGRRRDEGPNEDALVFPVGLAWKTELPNQSNLKPRAPHMQQGLSS